MNYTREGALQRIRQFLLSNMAEDETTCQTAARLGIFCHGYDQWTTQQLRDLYPWVADKLPQDATREELLKLVVAWDRARMRTHKTPVTCDAKSLRGETCLGFAGYNNEELKQMFPQL